MKKDFEAFNHGDEIEIRSLGRPESWEISDDLDRLAASDPRFDLSKEVNMLGSRSDRDDFTPRKRDMQLPKGGRDAYRLLQEWLDPVLEGERKTARGKDRVDMTKARRRAQLLAKYYADVSFANISAAKTRPDRWPEVRKRSKRTLAFRLDKALAHPAMRTVHEAEACVAEEIAELRIDPEGLSDANLDAFGIEAPRHANTGKKLTGLDRTEALITNGSIDDIREALIHLDPLRYPHIDKEKEPLDARWAVFDERGPFPGQLIRVRDDGPDHSVVARYEDALSAQRSIAHTRASYVTEAMRLMRVRHNLHRIHHDLEFWKSLTEEDKEAMRSEMIGIVNRLNPNLVTNQQKKRFINQIEAAMDLRDSLGRPNPSVARNRIITGTNNWLSKRFAQMTGISGTNLNDWAKLGMLIQDQEVVFEDFMREVERRAQSGEKASGNLRDKLLALRQRLAGIKMEPHYSYAQRLIEQVNLTLDKLGKHEGAWRAFMRIYFMAKLMRIYRETMEVYTTLSLESEECDTDAAAAELRDIVHRYRNEPKPVAPELKMSDFRQAYIDHYQMLEDVAELLENVKNEGFDRDECITEAKRRIKAFHFTDRIRDLQEDAQRELLS